MCDTSLAFYIISQTHPISSQSYTYWTTQLPYLRSSIIHRNPKRLAHFLNNFLAHFATTRKLPPSVTIKSHSADILADHAYPRLHNIQSKKIHRPDNNGGQVAKHVFKGPSSFRRPSHGV